MSGISAIEWTDATFNWWEGCQKVGPGCDHCYAEARNARFGGGVAPNWGPGAPRRLTSQHNRNNLRRWNAERFMDCNCGWRGSEKDVRKASGCPACGDGLMLMSARRRVFCSSLSDVFDNAVDQFWRDEMFAEMVAAPNLDFLVLTKRIGNVRGMVPAEWLVCGGWPAHIRIGATIVNQEEADRDIPKLLALPCPNFVSMEPLLGEVELDLMCENWSDDIVMDPETGARECCKACDYTGIGNDIDWVIVGGESGPGARPMHPDWARSLRDQCDAAGVPFLFKQWGEWTPGENVELQRGTVATATWFNDAWSFHEEDLRSTDGHRDDEPDLYRIGKKAAGRLLDGRTHDGFPGAA